MFSSGGWIKCNNCSEHKAFTVQSSLVIMIFDNSKCCLSVIPDPYPNYYKALEIYTGYFDSLDIMILFSYPSSIVITGDYCVSTLKKKLYQVSKKIVHIARYALQIYSGIAQMVECSERRLCVQIFCIYLQN